MSMVAIKELPILFSSPMVNAIQADLKSQTRRLVKLRDFGPSDTPGYDWCFRRKDGCWEEYTTADLIAKHCPYGVAGDRLYVRETVAINDTGDKAPKEHFLAEIHYPADGQVIRKPVHIEHWRCRFENNRLRRSPSIHMPRWASRLLLEITDVRVERLWDISEEDAIAEGLDVKTCERVFRKAAGRTRQKFARWLERKDGGSIDTGENGYVCADCAEKVAARHAAEIDGWNEHFETDTTPYCDECGVLLCHSLTEYGARSELGFTEDKKWFWPQLPVSGDPAFVLAELASGMGDLRDEHHGRMAQIAFATLWEQINGKSSWAANPWLWAISFRRIDA